MSFSFETPSLSDIFRRWPVLGVLVGSIFGFLLGILFHAIQ
jgi:hypothetical protein